MSVFPKLALVSASFAMLASCIPPDYPPPPPRFYPNPPHAPDVVYRENPYDVTAPPLAPVNPTPPPPSVTGGYPTATATDDPNKVVSPYPPYNVIDISDPRIPSGKLARDPTNRKIFRVP
jgi:hypothetical protein